MKSVKFPALPINVFKMFQIFRKT